MGIFDYVAIRTGIDNAWRTFAAKSSRAEIDMTCRGFLFILLIVGITIGGVKSFDCGPMEPMGISAFSLIATLILHMYHPVTTHIEAMGRYKNPKVVLVVTVVCALFLGVACGITSDQMAMHSDATGCKKNLGCTSVAVQAATMIDVVVILCLAVKALPTHRPDHDDARPIPPDDNAVLPTNNADTEDPTDGIPALPSVQDQPISQSIQDETPQNAYSVVEQHPARPARQASPSGGGLAHYTRGTEAVAPDTATIEEAVFYEAEGPGVIESNTGMNPAHEAPRVKIEVHLEASEGSEGIELLAKVSGEVTG